MRIHHEHKVEALGNGTSARLVVTTYIDDRVIAHNTALSGPKEDVEAYVRGELTWEQLEERWRMTRSVAGFAAKRELKKVGYWWSLHDQDLPKPQDHVDPAWAKTGECAIVLAHLENGRKKDTYRGFSVCRICHAANGSSDATDGVYVWPSGFAHYILVHQVKPSQDFIDHVLKSGGA